MNKILPILLFLPLFSAAQILTTSNLPIIVINTNDAIPDEPKVLGTMGIIDNGSGTNNINDPFNHYDGNIGIETRGNSTQGFDKKTYSLELRTAADQDTSVNLFGMGGEEDWILHAMIIDKTQLRIPFSFYLFQRMGHYASKWRYVELVVNGDYRGLYILCEKIKRDDDRVDIAKLDSDDLAGDSVTGGYILRIDWLEELNGFYSNHDAQGGYPMFFQWYYPKASNILPAQAQYIEGWMGNFEAALFSPSFTNGNGERYTDLINVNSFADFLIINELSKNSDGYKLSSYVHKDKDSKDGRLHAGPIWDFDQTYGVSLVCSNNLTNGWTYLQNQQECEDLESMPMWWQTMMSDTLFQHRVKCRWEELRNGPLHQDSIYDWMDTHEALISQAIGRNYTRWDDIIGEPIWIEPEPIPQTYAEEINVMKDWIAARLSWIDANLPGNCANDVLSIDDRLSMNFQVFPNPASDVINVVLDTDQRLKLIDFSGRILLDNQVRKGRVQLSVSEIASGTYILSTEGSNGTSTKLVVIE